MADSFLAQFEAQLASCRRLVATWEPAADLYRCADGWVIKFELAGVRKEDVEVKIGGGCITVIGSRLDRTPYPMGEAHLMEIAYSRFERSVTLPDRLAGADFHVLFEDGMLYVHVTAPEEGR